MQRSHLVLLQVKHPADGNAIDSSEPFLHLEGANLPSKDAAEKTANYVATNGGQRKLGSEKSSRQAWSMEDTKVIKRKFSEHLAASETGSLTKSEIETHWKKDDVLRAIYEREETFPGRTYIKVKTIFRWNALV